MWAIKFINQREFNRDQPTRLIQSKSTPLLGTHNLKRKSIVLKTEI